MNHFVDQNIQVDSISLDFAKAFDKVNFKILLNKLELFGFHSQVLKWFCSYISNRMQFVRFKGFESMKSQPKSGVPQGSTLGPLLFIMFINDITKNLNSNILLYADDIKLYKSIDNQDSCHVIQNDLFTIENWCINNDLHLNSNKCKVITFSRKKNPITYDYTINNNKLVRVSEIADLGVMFDSQLKFDSQIELVCTKSLKMLGFIFRRCSEFTDHRVIITLYVALVRSILEYCSQIWSPLYETYVDRIEKIQRKFTRFLFFKYKLSSVKLPYRVRLKQLELLPLVARREYLDELTLFKIINSIIDTQLLANLNFNVSSHNARNRNLFSVPKSRTNIGLNSTMRRMQRNHDNVFYSCDLFSSSLRSYKANLIKILNES